MLFWNKRRREEKSRQEILRAAKTYLWSYEDVQDLDMLASAVRSGSAERCKEILESLQKPLSFAAAREWLDILVVSISVAMAFRAYFYEPFNIPTGSMQPTLYGNHSVACSDADATWVDKSPVKWVKWAATGEMFESFKAPFTGYLQFAPRNDGYYNMFVAKDERDVNLYLATQRGSWLARKWAAFTEPAASPANPAVVPTDVLRGSAGDAPVEGELPALPNGLQHGSLVRRDAQLWSGYVVTGDFLFVNRWIWNFRHPRRGDVMVFSTTGIENLQQGTHYIKRMTGLPGETLEIKGGKLYTNGSLAEGGERVQQIQNREKYSQEEPAYAGYRPSGSPKWEIPGKTIAADGDVATLGQDEYYACGDNSKNSFDSRYWGPVPAANLRGMAGAVFWPFSHRWGNVK